MNVINLMEVVRRPEINDNPDLESDKNLILFFFYDCVKVACI